MMKLYNLFELQISQMHESGYIIYCLAMCYRFLANSTLFVDSASCHAAIEKKYGALVKILVTKI